MFPQPGRPESFTSLMDRPANILPDRPAAGAGAFSPEELDVLLTSWREIPLYRERLADVRSAADFANIPFTEKEDLRRNFPCNFLGSGVDLQQLIDLGEIELEYTSGTSSDQMGVLLRPGWWDAQEDGMLRLNSHVNGVLTRRPNARRVTLATPACQGRVCLTSWRSVAERTVGNTLFVNQARIPFALADSDLDRMAQEVSDWAPQFLDAAPAHGAWLALHCERRGISFPSLKFILCSYEFVSVVHRRILERVFKVPVFNLYGSTETGHLLMEDDSGRMVSNAGATILETVPTVRRGIDELVVTSLTNDVMPLLRYRIGDLVERRGTSAEAACVVHGRRRDALSDASGLPVTPWEVDQCFEGMDGVAHYQVQRTGSATHRLLYVPANEGPSAKAIQTVATRLENRLQAKHPIGVEAVKIILPAQSGKFRLTLPAEPATVVGI